MAELGRRLNSIAFGMSFARLEPEIIDSLSLWIKGQFGDISMQEIALAFELVTAKKLPMGKNEGRHYAKFDMQYIGDVLHAFKMFRNIQWKLYEDAEKTKNLTEGNYEKVSGKEMYEGIKRISLKDGKLMRAADWSAAFLYAQKEGFIYQLNNDEKQMYLDNVRASLKSEAVKSPDYQELLNTLTNPDSLITECRKRILHTHFQKMIDDSKVSEKGNG